MVEDVTRHGKFLDIDASRRCTSSSTWPAPAGSAGATRSRRCRRKPATSRRSPLRVVLDDGSRARHHRGRHQEEPRRCTSSATPATCPASPASARTRSPTSSPSRRSARSSPTPAASRSRACCATRARSPASATPTPTRSCTPRGCRRSSRPPRMTEEESQTLYDAIRTVLGDAVDRSRGLAASELKGEKKSHLAVHGRTGKPCPVCGDTVREVQLRRLQPAVLPDLPDRRQAARRPPDVPTAEVRAPCTCPSPP